MGWAPGSKRTLFWAPPLEDEIKWGHFFHWITPRLPVQEEFVVWVDGGPGGMRPHDTCFLSLLATRPQRKNVPQKWLQGGFLGNTFCKTNRKSSEPNPTTVATAVVTRGELGWIWVGGITPCTPIPLPSETDFETIGVILTSSPDTSTLPHD